MSYHDLRSNLLSVALHFDRSGHISLNSRDPAAQTLIEMEGNTNQQPHVEFSTSELSLLLPLLDVVSSCYKHDEQTGNFVVRERFVMALTSEQYGMLRSMADKIRG